ncbi:MAG TPA: PDZ domain-containing protein [Firmicutes bacterium]|nr:PDZ domain-containing protein [Bacillota bacterium]
MRKLNKVLKPAIIIFIIAAGLFFRTDYYLIMPGTAEELRPLIDVENTDPDDRGKFYLVTVSQQQANLLSLAYGYLHPDIELQRVTEVVPPGMDLEEYQELMKQWMRESQLMAQVIALTRAGYQIEIESQGVVIRGFLEGSPAKGIFKEGDIILAVDGKKVSLTEQVISLVQNRGVGDSVTIKVQRDEQELELTSVTYPSPDNQAVPALGVYISSLGWEPVIPIQIEIKTGEISGPSAGMMFVLEILNQLTPGDLTKGHLIAGTGTIELNEKVGQIGGVQQKVIAAEKEGAEYFLVPVENYPQAKQAARQITLVPVSSLQEVLDFLDQLAPY